MEIRFPRREKRIRRPGGFRFPRDRAETDGTAIFYSAASAARAPFRGASLLIIYLATDGVNVALERSVASGKNIEINGVVVLSFRSSASRSMPQPENRPRCRCIRLTGMPPRCFRRTLEKPSPHVPLRGKLPKAMKTCAGGFGEGSLPRRTAKTGNYRKFP